MSDCSVSETLGHLVMKKRARAPQGFWQKDSDYNPRGLEGRENTFSARGTALVACKLRAGFLRPASTADYLCLINGAVLQFKASTSPSLKEGKLGVPRTVPGLDQPPTDRSPVGLGLSEATIVSTSHCHRPERGECLSCSIL